MRVPTPILKMAVLAALAAAALAGCGDDDSVFGSSTTAAPTTTTTTSTTTTTAPPTTAAPPTTEATTTTTTTTTTTVEPTLGPPPLPLEFRPDGLNIVAFGAAPGHAVDVVGAYLGMAPTFDSGWGPAWGDYGICPGTEYRQVEFAGLVLMFTDAGIFQPEGTRQFFAWGYNGSPPDATPLPLEVGATVANVLSIHPAAELIGDDPIYGAVFRVEGAADGEQLWGRLTGINPADTIEYLAGGWGCGE